MKPVLVTGAAGFIGYHLARKYLAAGRRLVGFHNLNDYYDVSLKAARLANLAALPGFTFVEGDLADRRDVDGLFTDHRFEIVVNLAAQAGVRYSLENPQRYIRSNLEGFTSILEACRHGRVGHLVCASSSSVYGANTRMPFSVHQNVDHPVSLYGATKKANELLAHSYSHLFGLPTTGLRFFTGPSVSFGSSVTVLLRGGSMRAGADRRCQPYGERWRRPAIVHGRTRSSSLLWMSFRVLRSGGTNSLTALQQPARRNADGYRYFAKIAAASAGLSRSGLKDSTKSPFLSMR